MTAILMNASLSIAARRAGIALCLWLPVASQAGQAPAPADPQTVARYLKQAKVSQQPARLLGES